MLRTKKRSLSMFLVLAMVLSLFAAFNGTALAATSNPNMMSYDIFTSPNYTPYTYTVSGGAQDLFAGPTDSTYAKTYFDNYDDAYATDWVIISDGSITSAGIAYKDGIDLGIDGWEWAACATVDISDPSEVGSVSLKVYNPNSIPANAYVNLTLVQNEEANPPEEYTSASSVRVWVYNPGTGTMLKSDPLTVQNTDYYETYYRSFPTGLDALAKAKDATLIADFGVDSYPGMGDFVNSITIGSTTWGPNYTTGEGWLYRVYRGAGTTKSVVELTEYVGADSVRIRDGDVVVWRYGGFGYVFPTTITVP